MESMRNLAIVVPTYPDSLTALPCVRSLPSSARIKSINRNDMTLSQKRNYGATHTTGKYILFCDDDNIILKHSVRHLLETMAHDRKIGVAGMIAIYSSDPTPKVCDSGSFRNMLTGFTTDKYANRLLSTVSESPYEVDEVANVFMVRRDIFEKVGKFDADRFPIDLDEADLCRRIKQAGYKIVIDPKAITVHKHPTDSRMPNFRRPINAYMMGRNRILFQRKHLPPSLLRVHLVAFLPVFVLSYVVSLYIKKNTKMIPYFLKGVSDGLRNRLDYTKRFPNLWN